jgi:hypothetical protein
MNPKSIRLLQFLLFGGLASTQIICAVASFHYGGAVHPLLLASVFFYPPILIALMIARRSWVDILVVSLVLVLLANSIDGIAFPFGTYGLIGINLAWAIGTLISISRRPDALNK